MMIRPQKCGSCVNTVLGPKKCTSGESTFRGFVTVAKFFFCVGEGKHGTCTYAPTLNELNGIIKHHEWAPSFVSDCLISRLGRYVKDKVAVVGVLGDLHCLTDFSLFVISKLGHDRVLDKSFVYLHPYLCNKKLLFHILILFLK